MNYKKKLKKKKKTNHISTQQKSSFLIKIKIKMVIIGIKLRQKF